MVCGELCPERIVYRALAVQAVAQPDQRAIGIGPAGVVGSPRGQGHDLRFCEAGFGGEDTDVHAPLVLGATCRRYSIDDDLSLPDGQMTPVE